jgi:hypothetical protein
MHAVDDSSRSPERVLCPKCLLSNTPSAAFCADCGAPIGMVSTVDPMQLIQAEGFAYRSAVDGPPKLIVLLGMWVIFGPMLIAGPFVLFEGPVRSSETLTLTLVALASAVVLYRTTRNYYVKSRSSIQPDG